MDNLIHYLQLMEKELIEALKNCDHSIFDKLNEYSKDFSKEELYHFTKIIQTGLKWLENDHHITQKFFENLYNKHKKQNLEIIESWNIWWCLTLYYNSLLSRII